MSEYIQNYIDIYKGLQKSYQEMISESQNADHVTAWSKGGSSDAKNCQMLCKTHIQAKGNR